MGLNLSDIPDRTVIYVDANIFLFSAFKHPLYGDVCKEFLLRMEGYACTSDYSLNEIFHKLMIAETSKKFAIRPKEVIFFIKKNPTIISELKEIWEEMELIAESKIQIISDGKLFPDFIETSKSYNLMATDAMIIEIMKRNGLKDIATNDGDFERIEGLTVWKP